MAAAVISASPNHSVISIHRIEFTLPWRRGENRTVADRDTPSAVTSRRAGPPPRGKAVEGAASGSRASLNFRKQGLPPAPAEIAMKNSEGRRHHTAGP